MTISQQNRTQSFLQEMEKENSSHCPPKLRRATKARQEAPWEAGCVVLQMAADTQSIHPRKPLRAILGKPHGGDLDICQVPKILFSGTRKGARSRSSIQLIPTNEQISASNRCGVSDPGNLKTCQHVSNQQWSSHAALNLAPAFLQAPSGSTALSISTQTAGMPLG